MCKIKAHKRYENDVLGAVYAIDKLRKHYSWDLLSDVYSLQARLFLSCPLDGCMLCTLLNDEDPAQLVLALELLPTPLSPAIVKYIKSLFPEDEVKGMEKFANIILEKYPQNTPSIAATEVCSLESSFHGKNHGANLTRALRPKRRSARSVNGKRPRSPSSNKR